MVRKIKEWEEVGRAHAQENDIRRRNYFLKLNRSTQQKIIELVERTAQLIDEKSVWEAQQYVFGEIFSHQDEHHRWIEYEDGTDWSEIYDHVRGGYCSDHDMEGLTLVSKRVTSELVVYKALAELSE